jgi:hypothetical protein
VNERVARLVEPFDVVEGRRAVGEPPTDVAGAGTDTR